MPGRAPGWAKRSCLPIPRGLEAQNAARLRREDPLLRSLDVDQGLRRPREYFV